jgi:cytochrome c553
MRLKSFCVAVSVLICAPITLALALGRQDYAAVIRSKPNLEHGAEVFRDCIACHGISGTGTSDGKVPRIAGQHFRLLAKQLVDYRYEERDIRMEDAIERHLLRDAQTIADVAAYVSQLESPDLPRRDKRAVTAPGAELYAARCQSCHGPAGEGNADKAVPRLAGQRYMYLVRQMHAAISGRRSSFSPRHVRLLEPLERDDILDVADFLSRSVWTDPAPPPSHSR